MLILDSVEILEGDLKPKCLQVSHHAITDLETDFCNVGILVILDVLAQR